MEIREIKQIQKKVTIALNQKRIKGALALIGSLAKEFQSGSIIDDHYNIELTYRSLLNYSTGGASDPEQQQMYTKIVGDTLKLSDKLFSFIYSQKSNDFIYQVRRNLSTNNDLVLKIENLYSGITQDTLAKEINQSSSVADPIAEDIFNSLISADGFSANDLSALAKLLVDEEVSYVFRSIFISAITIGLLQDFKEEKLLILFDAININNQEVKHRALVGLILCLYKYDDRLKYYPNILDRLKLLADNEKDVNTILALVINLIRTRETEKIITKLNEEILPEVVKMHPNLRNKLDIEDMISDKFVEGENPDWEDFFADSPELQSKLEEITEWQLEGADVFLSTFKTLKHFPFFNDLKNWLIPFYTENTALSEGFKQNEFIFGSSTIQESLTNSGFLCNSDKYSLFLSVPFMPSFQKDMMAKMFEQQLEQMDDIEKDDALVKPEKKEANISNRYIQDLYRFYKLFPQRKQFDDVFSWSMSFHKKDFMKVLLADDKYMRKIGEFFFTKHYYKEASEAFKSLLKDNANHIELIQKTAYSLQKEGNFGEALKLYLHADILSPDQVWTVKKIALMYKSKGDAAKALEYYLQAEKIKPDDLHTQALIGHCHLDLKNYKEALQYYFKVEYLDQTNTKVWSPIAWCSFVSGNLVQAEKYYQKLLVSSSNTQDFINIGHVYLCMNERNKALMYYTKAINKMGNSAAFFKVFDEDTEQLIASGVPTLDLPLIIDQLKYSLEA